MAPPGSPAMTSEDIGEVYRLPGSMWHIATLVFIQTYLDVQTWMLKLPHIVDCVNLYKRCWKTERPVFKEEHGIKHLCDDIPVFRDWLHHLRIVMIRTEYETLWKTIKTQMLEAHHGGMVVVGQPGVGKSFFTRVARVLALQDGIPTIFCDTKEYYWYADDNGCRKVRLDASDPHSIQAGTLVLVDSSAALKAPPSRFCTENFPGYIVQATSPQEDRWKRWMKHRNGVAWVMSPWQQDEVKSLQKFLEIKGRALWVHNPEWYTPLELFELLGPSARTCFTSSYQQLKTLPADERDATILPSHLFDSPDDIVKALTSGTVSPALQQSDFDMLCVATNASTSNPVLLRPRFKYDIPTPYLRLLAATHFRKLPKRKRLELFLKISSSPQIAAKLLEPLAFNLLAT
ncbi:hypothetical protein C8Q76DRAFT_797471 [Earliella scabrosa]|nr:hypothetical protein C8Q76DRAFT_797471 [Earliella scabrosa]